MSYLIEKKLADASTPVTNDYNADFKVVYPEDFGKFADNFKKYGYPPEIVFRKADFFVAAIFNGEILHWELVSSANEIYAMELERSFRLPPNSGYVYSGFTPPKYRGKGWATRVLEKTYNYLNEKGISEAYSLVRANNFAQRTIFRKLNCRKIGEIRFVRILGLKFYKFKYEVEDRQKLNQIFSSGNFLQQAYE